MEVQSTRDIMILSTLHFAMLNKTPGQDAFDEAEGQSHRPDYAY